MPQSRTGLFDEPTPKKAKAPQSSRTGLFDEPEPQATPEQVSTLVGGILPFVGRPQQGPQRPASVDLAMMANRPSPAEAKPAGTRALAAERRRLRGPLPAPPFEANFGDVRRSIANLGAAG